MKKLTLYILLLGGLFTGACRRDFLAPDFSISTSYTEELVFTSAVEAQKVLNNCYAYLQPFSAYRMRYGLAPARSGSALPASYTDEAANGTTTAQSWSVTNGSFNQFFNPDNMWETCYQGIRRCNMFLENIDRVQDGDPPIVARWKHEVRFLRAFYYFELFRRYGGVPLVKKALSVQGVLNNDLSEYYIPRATVDEVVDFISKELDTAAVGLPTVYGSGDLGRITKQTALGYKGRLLLYYASELHNPGNANPQRWRAAADACRTAIDTAEGTGGHKLHTNYQRMFLNDSRTNKETLLFIYESIGSAYDLREGHPSAGRYGGTNPTLNLVDKYEMKNGKSISDPTSGYDPQQPFKDRDPRLGMSVVQPLESWFGVQFRPWYGPGGLDGRSVYGAKPNDGSWTSMLVKKFVDVGEGANRNWTLMRLGELYLNYAEAENEAAGPVAAVYKYMNLIRARTGVAMPALPAGISKDSMRTRIRNERSVELAFEEHRGFDARRWKIAEQTFGGATWGWRTFYNAQTGALSYTRYNFQNRIYKKHWNLYPIPQTEIERSKGSLVQNPGY